ncbi:hypothetical protein FISHEDRAFT_78625 [Fistulina hepatica ATCC 64428]|uniref:Probable RNA polymerase II nuclear localization protein SLC7A6OS n=1 Tax=Fistulina hepatica ATCC 64428 TaxID=1128425 RepID=A0A0D7A0H2_9AGAR|nr:hypothetical protein FISHEDRAFT_78625 [Fistulina hepatica ATCC 64428]
MNVDHAGGVPMQLSTSASAPSSLHAGFSTTETVQTGSQSLTLLRIKRPRNDEPLDALVIESTIRRKKNKRKDAREVFSRDQHETVEPGAWENEVVHRRIQDQIAQLTQTAASSPPRPRHIGSAPTPRRHKYTIVPSSSAGGPSTAPSESALSRQDSQIRIYDAVLEREGSQPPAQDQQNGISKTVKDQSVAQPSLETVDAKRLTDESDGVSSATQPDAARKQSEESYFHTHLEATLEATDDDEMEKFLPLLNDYLKLHDIDVHPSHQSSALLQPTRLSASTSVNERNAFPLRAPPPVRTATSVQPRLPFVQALDVGARTSAKSIGDASVPDAMAVLPASSIFPVPASYPSVVAPATAPTGADGPVHDDDDDYVWDVFFRAPAAAAQQWMSFPENVGLVTGFPPLDEDYESGSDDTGPEDEDDEDSNAEDFYTHDYPDEDDDWSGDDHDGAENSDLHDDFDELHYGRVRSDEDIELDYGIDDYDMNWR